MAKKEIKCINALADLVSALVLAQVRFQTILDDEEKSKALARAGRAEMQRALGKYLPLFESQEKLLILEQAFRTNGVTPYWNVLLNFVPGKKERIVQGAKYN